jgi:dipeptidyl aminopeptidase/acylaminoacyl peptidase
MVGAAGGQTVSAKRPMTFADLMAMKRVSDPQISPSGKWVMFSVTEVSLEKNTKVNHLWVVPVDGAAKERQVTFSTGESNGRFSPNGQFVMFTGAPNDTDAVSRIAIATWDEATGKLGVARTLDAVSGDADGAIWSPDSRHFLFTTEVYPECSDKATWTEEDACDKAKDDAAAKSPVKAQVWDHLLYRHWNAYTGEKRSHIILADFSMDGANPRDLTPRSVVGDAVVPTFQLSAPLGYAWAPDSREIAYVVNLDKVPAESTNNDIFVLQVGAAPSTAKKVSVSAGSDDGPAYSPDGKWLAWRSQKRNGFESDKFGLVKMDRATGKITDVMPKFDEWIDSFVWSHNSKFFYITAPYDGGEKVLTGPWHDGEKDAGAGDENVSPGFDEGGRGSGEIGDVQLSTDGRFLIATRMYVDQPSEVVVRPAKDCDDADQNCESQRKEAPPAVQLTHLNADLLGQLALSPLERFWFTGAGTTRVEGFVVRPPGFDPGKKYPVKFLMHGGPQGNWGDGWSYRWNPELFAASGYVVVMVNPRGSTGYGQQFVDEVSGDWGGRPFVDLMKGLDAAEAKFPFLDKTRECALGASYGGYMADWVLTHTNRFKCIVTHDGMYDPVSAFGATEELWFNEWEFRPLAAGVEKQIPGGNDRKKSNGNDDVVEQGKAARPWDFYGKPAAEDPFRRWSPMMFIKEARTPTLVVHSQRDYRLDVSQGLQLFTALQLLGVPSKMLYFPDEGHWVLKPQNAQLWWETVDDWCDRWTGMGKYAGVGPEKNPMAESLVGN